MFLDFPRGLFCQCTIPVKNCHLAAFAGQALCNRLANAIGRARDERHLSIDSQIQGVFLVEAVRLSGKSAASLAKLQLEMSEMFIC
ncbi:hypothetical protein D3C71_1996940 [compost metagenome]